MALAVAFRDEPGPGRAVTIAVTVLLGLLLLVALVLAAGQIDRSL